MHYQAITADGSVQSSYMCQHCFDYTANWNSNEWESTYSGDIAYWKDEVWHPMHE